MGRNMRGRIRGEGSCKKVRVTHQKKDDLTDSGMSSGGRAPRRRGAPGRAAAQSAPKKKGVIF